MRNRNGIKRLATSGLRDALKDMFGIAALQDQINDLNNRLNERLDKLETALYESKEDARERSRSRWRNTEPVAGLTWGKKISGQNFISKIASYKAFGPDKSVLEVGPGYGRLLQAMLEMEIPFDSYLGVDISAKNVARLKEQFSNAKIDFLPADVETAELGRTFDVVFSSLTFKHLFPSFEKALINLTRFINPGGMYFIDLIEGKQRYFEDDGVTYIRLYERTEVEEILERAKLGLVAFDQVQHDPEHVRLLVVAKK